MRLRWLLALFLGVVLVGPQAPAWAQQQLPTDPVRLLDQNDAGLTVEFSASLLEFQQTPAYAAIISPDPLNSTRQGSLPGVSAFPVLTALVGLPPTGSVDVQVLADDAQPVGDARLLAAADAGQPQSGGLVRLADEAWVRDRRVVRLEVRPFQAQSGGQAARWHQRLRVSLHFNGAAAAADQAPALSTAARDDAGVQSQLINAAQARGWRAASPAATGAVRDPFAGAAGDTPLGARYKVVVDEDGLYRLTVADLQNPSLNLSGVDPRNIHLTSQGLAIPIYISGEGDGVFNAGDTLLFYGQKFRGDRLAARHPEESSYYSVLTNGFHPQFNATQAEKYTAENVYWLTVEATPGLRTATLAAPPAAASPATVTRPTVHFEQSNFWWTWHYTSQDTWFWDRLTLVSPTPSLDRSYTLDLPNPVPAGTNLTISGDLVARVSNVAISPDHHTKIMFNSALVEDVKWDGPTRHHFTGSVPASALLATNTLHVQLFLDAYAGQSNDDIYFDWVDVAYDRNLTAVSDALTFQGTAPVNRYKVNGLVSAPVELWDITQPLAPVRLTGFDTTTTPGTLDFQTTLTGTAGYLVAGSAALKTPKRVEYYNPPDLLSAGVGADYIIITHASFIATAQRLANFRAAQGLRVKIIDFADLVNQFNDGIYHPIAIKNFLAYTFLHWQAPAPATVVLVGDGSWNLRGFNPAVYGSAPIYLPPNLAWVDYPDVSTINQGEIESTNLLANVVGLDPLPDVAIGRIPVNSTTELNTVIDKIIAYEQAPTGQAWQKNFFFIAGAVPDPAGDFQAISNSISTDFVKPPYQTLTAYMGTDVVAQTTRIINGFNLGALVVSYVGHGSFGVWSGSMFNTTHIPQLANGDRLPLVLSMTCSDGYWMFPQGGTANLPTGFAEELLRAVNKGAIATFSPTGFDDVYGHDKLQRGLMTALLKHYVTNLGALTNAARLNLYAGGTNLELLHQFVLFGDPALNLKLPYSTTYVPAVAKH